MKKFILIFAMVAAAFNSNGQITLEKHDTVNWIKYTYLEDYGTKYYIYNQVDSQIVLYNLNHSIFKTIQIPEKPFYSDVLYVSNTLFDTDKNTIEYALIGASTFFQPYFIKIYKENGSLLLNESGIYINLGIELDMRCYILPTDSNAKMIIHFYNSLGSNAGSKIYNLPGKLSCDPCKNPIGIGIGEYNNNTQQGMLLNNFPNPTNDYTRIDYQLPQGTHTGEIVFYDTQGKETKRFKVDNSFDHLRISTADLPSGTYLYHLQTGQSVSGAKKMVVVK